MKGSVKKVLISALLGGIILLFAAYFQLALIFAPAAIAFVGAAWGTGMALIPVVMSLVGLFAMAGVDGLLTSAMFLPAGIIIWVCLKKRIAYRLAAGASAAAEALALYGITCLPSVLAGGGPFDAYTEYMAILGEAFVVTSEEMGISGEMAATIEKYAAYFEVMAPDMAVMTIIALGMLSGFACTLIARWACTKVKAEVKPMAPFSHWQLSKEFSRGSIVLIIGALVCSLAKLKNASAVVVAIECIVGGPYALMGICFVAFAIKYRVRGGGMLVMAIIGMVLMFPYSIYGLAFMGMADKAFKMRKNMLAARNRKL